MPKLVNYSIKKEAYDIVHLQRHDTTQQQVLSLLKSN